MSQLRSISSTQSTDEIVTNLNLEAKSCTLQKVLNENINTAISGNEGLDKLNETAKNVHEHADAFSRTTSVVRKQKFIELAKVKAVWLLLIIFLICALVMILKRDRPVPPQDDL
eukprot:117070_1